MRPWPILARAGAGSTAKEQGVVAGRHVQPTPRSLAVAEEKLGEMSMETIELVKQAMMRARAVDSAGDNVACKQAMLRVVISLKNDQGQVP
jgi:hypothetical protein